MFEIFALAALLCVVGAIVEYIKEKREPEIPAENWANEDLKHQDIMNGVPMDQIIKYAREGRYIVIGLRLKTCIVIIFLKQYPCCWTLD